jgi:hypothetical protein
MSLDGKPLAGWVQYALSPTNAGWLAWMFYQHWLYTSDETFLRERAYPWCSEVAESLLAMLTPDENGNLKLALSSSPEVRDNSLRAWLTPNTNYDQACLKATFLGLADMARALKRDADAAKWASAAERLGGFLSEPDTGCLMFAAGEEVRETHRHLSHSMAIHPFGLINTDTGDADKRTIAATCKRYDEVGTGAWCGYSFSWMSCLRARVGDAEAAVHNLDLFVKAFVLRNGFHANGDQSGMGFSGFTYRPFTLEGNFLAAQALQEMMLQSWSPDPEHGEGATVRIFPAMPWRWHEASFRDLRAEGGYRVSARRENNATTWFEVTATRAGRLRIRDNFGGRTPSWSRGGVAREGSDYIAGVAAGETLSATLEAPAAVPPAPPDLAEPVEIPTGRIRANRLPLRIGADSNGGNRFVGDIAQVRVYDRAIFAEEIAQLALPGAAAAPGEGCIVALDFAAIADGTIANLALADLPARVVGSASTVDAGPDLGGSALHLTGEGFVEIAHTKRLNCENGVTVAAWIRPERLPESGARIIDKSPVGAASGYMIDTYPGDSLRLIFRDPHLRYAAKLPLGKWTHVAATVDGATGACVLYVNGAVVAKGG